MDTPTKERHDVGYLSKILESWKSVPKAKFPSSVEKVSNADYPTMPIEVQFERDGLKWRSDYRICILEDCRGSWANLFIHLPNDGFFYVEESLLDVLKSDCPNIRHENACREGWAYLEASVWPKLKDFETFACTWYGYDDNAKLEHQILYNDARNRLDIACTAPRHVLALISSLNRAIRCQRFLTTFGFRRLQRTG